MNLKQLMGSGDKIFLLTLPFVVIGLVLNVLFPSFFSVGGPPSWLMALSVVVLVLGLTIWLWSVVLILTLVPKHQLITNGPFAFVKHPLYTAVALLVLPWIGFLLDTWLGVAIGLVLYLAARRYEPEEESGLAGMYGAAWDEYAHQVKLAWL